MITHESSLENFTLQLTFTLNAYEAHGLKASQFQNVVLGGLGGSGIGAAIAKTLMFGTFPLPIECVNDYHLPSYAGKNTLVILNSYSGNTEETLTMFEEALERGCHMLLISSGGKLKELGAERNLRCYPLETGFQPRMTIGYGLSYLLMILSELQGTLPGMQEELKQTIALFEENNTIQKRSAEKIFNFFKSNLQHKFVILADSNFSPVALRFCQQMQENAKVEAFTHLIPEANHNVLESYTGKLPSNFILLYTDLNPRVAARFDFVQSHLEVHNNKVLPMFIPEYSIQSVFDIIYRLDWVSVMIANELNAPLMEVPIITELKEYLNALVIEDSDEEE